jgi:hypothetical protein
VRVDSRPRKRNAPRIAEKDAPGFLQWIRGRRTCVWQGKGECGGKIEPQHLDFAGGKGVGTKVADRYVLPCCSVHHTWQHLWGWKTFLTRMEATESMALRVADRLWFKWPGRPAWERKLSDG